MDVTVFQIEGTPQSCARYGSGHINETYLVVTDKPHRYILQKINHTIFRDVPGLMGNISAVTAYLRAQTDDPRRVLTLVPTADGASYHVDEAGEFWRLYEFVEGGLCLDRAQTVDEFYQSAVAFGGFQDQLAAFPVDTLCEVIPRFHDTKNRVAQLRDAVAKDAVGRVASVQRELDFAMARAEEAGAMVDMLARGELPPRVTHNDTKLNNVILDAVSHTPLCVIDLDTVMPGLVANDFGDSIRFGASTAAEDETDLSKVTLSLTLYDAYLDGFLGACGARLTPLEVETLPLGAKLMTYENGIRFLADYLAGDVYYHIARPSHNLDRCRTQFALIEDMERKWARMNEAVRARR